MLPSIDVGGSAGSQGRCACGCVLADREIVVDEPRPQIAIGRADENDVVIRGNLISRIHARIEISRNKFLLIDQSTNGTFVQFGRMARNPSCAATACSSRARG